MLGLLLGLLALGPGLRRGYILSYDMVFVPRPPVTARTFGVGGPLPRTVPSDAFAVALGHVLPADIGQKLVLVGVFVLAASGAAALVPSRRLLARLSAAACYAWTPFVAERLVIGHWPLLLGYAGLPWAVRAATTVDRGRLFSRCGGVAALVRALIPAAIGGIGGLATSAPVLIGVAVTCRSRVRALARVLAAVMVLSLVWAVPALLINGVTTDSDGVAAFASRADTPFGTLGSLVMLGGVWNREVVPPAYDVFALAVPRLALSLVGIVGYLLAARYGRRPPGWGGLLAGGFVGYAIAALGTTGAGQDLLRTLLHVWPAFGEFRDAQRYVMPLALIEAVGLGLLVDVAVPAGRAAADRAVGHLAGHVIGVFGVLAPIALLPGLAFGAAGRLDAVSYPTDWARARTVLDAQPARGGVAVLPWRAYRNLRWNAWRTSYDPAPQYFGHGAVGTARLPIGRRTLAADDPRSRRLDAAILGASRSRLAALGIRYILIEHGQGANRYRLQKLLGKSREIYSSTDISLYRLVTFRPHQGNGDGRPWVAGSWTVTLAAMGWSLAARRRRDPSPGAAPAGDSIAVTPGPG